MYRIIYVDFDGVLVDTPRYIKKIIETDVNKIEILKKIQWDIILEKCKEINNNILCIKKLSEKFNVNILTHVYSSFEAKEKKKYISKYISNINVITVPYYMNKNEVVSPKNNILIDDYRKNIINWEKAGGIGIHFSDTKEITDLLNDYIF